jgi:hypothetical protein
MKVRTDEDAERLAELLKSDKRQQPVLAVASAPLDTENSFLEDVTPCAREAFTLQHVAAVTGRGLLHLDGMLGSHALPQGAIRIYLPGYSSLAVQQAHPLTPYKSVIAHQGGRKGMLNRLRIRCMTQDAWERRGDRM